uniref:Uncharacterized protein n=1 Tax=Salix viminalis TaxID=40686 RepID=A0A6N2LFG8_SALVM
MVPLAEKLSSNVLDCERGLTSVWSGFYIVDVKPQKHTPRWQLPGEAIRFRRQLKRERVRTLQVGKSHPKEFSAMDGVVKMSLEWVLQKTFKQGWLHWLREKTTEDDATNLWLEMMIDPNLEGK